MRLIGMIVVLAFAITNLAFAHPGRLDKNGGHNKTADGTYHYHYGDDTVIEYGVPLKAEPVVAGPVQSAKAVAAPVAFNPADFPVVDSGPPSVTEPGIDMFLNGEKLVFDVPPVIINDRVMVPLRAVAEAVGATVIWVDEYKMASLEKDGKVVILVVDSKKADLNGTIFDIDAAPVILNGRVLIPLRTLIEALGASVETVWTDAVKQIDINIA